MCHDHRGFTLIEVMIGAVILFSILAIGTLSFRVAMNSLARVSARVVIADAVPAVMATIRRELFQDKKAGSGDFGSRVSYTWRAEEISSAKNMLSAAGEFTGGSTYGKFTMTLNNIKVTMKYHRDNWQKKLSFTYRELVWSR